MGLGTIRGGRPVASANQGRGTVREPSTIRHRIQILDDARHLTAAQIRQRFSVSHIPIVRSMAGAGFPKPVKFAPSKDAVSSGALADVEPCDRERARVS